MRVYPRFQNLKDFMSYCVMLEAKALEMPIVVDEEFLDNLAIRLMMADRKNQDNT